MLTAFGLAVGIASDGYHAASWAAQPASDTPAAEESAAADSEKVTPRFSDLRSSLTTLSDGAYQPSDRVLNLAYYYPDGADESDVINSYAGQIYKKLMLKDAQYLADIYDLGSVTPLEMARRLGLSSDRVLGKYNPDDSGQSSDNPASWIIRNFKNVNVSFYDADGKRINGYSNVKDIMAMANVYMFAHDYLDADAFENYCLTLYDQSHSYKITMGNVYYCSGCLNKTAAEEAQEALEEEAKQAALEQQLAGATQQSSGEQKPDGMTPVETGEPDGSTGTSASAAASGISDVGTGSFGTDGFASGETVSDAAQQVNGSSGQQASSQAGNQSAAAEQSVTTEAQNGVQSAGNTAGTDSADSTSSGSGTADVSSVTSATPSTAQEIGPGITTAAQTESSTETQTSAPETEEALPSVQSAAQNSAETGRKSSYCPGHIDLYVTVTLLGFDDQNGLTALSDAGKEPDADGGSWQGWTDAAREAAAAMIAEDWFQRYGLTISAINVKKPLTQEEISAYLSRLSDDISAERRAVVEFALNSVGKVPYYYGGKASAQNYEGNGFGTVVSASDPRGRVLRGLDCSGWVSWVYWSALGNRLPAESTGTLIGCGRKISRSELKPGDIIIRTGTDAHAVMFLEWTTDGKFIGIHENGTSNNVTVAEMSANWPYYRSLLD